MCKEDVSTEKNVCFTGVSRVRKKVIITVRTKMVQLHFNGKKKGYFNIQEKGCFDG